MSKHHDKIKNDPRWKAARAECLDRDGHACVTCGSTDRLHVDHIVPLALGGDPFDLENLQTLCHVHNLAKGATPGRVVRVEWINEKYRGQIGSALF